MCFNSFAEAVAAVAALPPDDIHRRIFYATDLVRGTYLRAVDEEHATLFAAVWDGIESKVVELSPDGDRKIGEHFDALRKARMNTDAERRALNHVLYEMLDRLSA
jgi:hypothetical protein